MHEGNEREAARDDGVEDRLFGPLPLGFEQLKDLKLELDPLSSGDRQPRVVGEQVARLLRDPIHEACIDPERRGATIPDKRQVVG